VKAVATLKNQEPYVPIAKVDATVATKVAALFEVKGYPTIKFFTNGKAIEFNGGRTDKDIVSWITKKTG